MQLPGTMTAPRMRLAYGEEVLHAQPALRRKGLFGNRYGELYVTNQRVAFVKAVMRSGIASGEIDPIGAKPMLVFDRGAISGCEKIAVRRHKALVITRGDTTERFIMAERAIDAVLPLLA
jgi:hypothetical protein